MDKAVKSIVAMVITAAVALVAFREWRRSLLEGLSVGKIADIETNELLSLLGGVTLVLVIVVIVWMVKHRSTAVLERRDDAPYPMREIPNYQAPQAQLPAPWIVNAPVVRSYGQTTPLMAETVVRSLADDVEIAVPYRYLLRFAKCPTPSRTEWTGKPAVFYEAQGFFALHGFLFDNGKAKTWKAEYPIECRLTWLQQFEHVEGANNGTVDRVERAA